MVHGKCVLYLLKYTKSQLIKMCNLKYILDFVMIYKANVTGYWKTDRVHTFGQLHFIGPANSHAHTLPVHYYINGLS